VKVALLGDPVVPFHDFLAGRLPAGFELISIPSGAAPSEVRAGMDGAEAAIAVRYDTVIATDDALRLVQVPGVGYDEIALSALPARASLCNVKGHGPGSAEYAILAMLEWSHRFCSANAGFRAGSWARSSRFKSPPHKELFGSTVGLVGYGLIGSSIAERLAGFGVTTLVSNRTPPSNDGPFAETYELDRLADMAARCDFLIVSIALTPETEGLVDADVLAALSSEGVLVNIARGPVVNEDALFGSLSEGHLGGAILDVWYNYPENADDGNARPSRHDFASLPNVYMTPHISGWTEGTVERRWTTIAENLVRLANGDPLLNIVHQPFQDTGSP